MRLLYKLVQKALELEFGEDFGESCRVGFLKLQSVEVEVDGNIGADGGEKLRHAYIVDSALNLLAQLAFYLCRVFEDGVDAAELGDELGGCLRTYARTTREVVG